MKSPTKLQRAVLLLGVCAIVFVLFVPPTSVVFSSPYESPRTLHLGRTPARVTVVNGSALLAQIGGISIIAGLLFIVVSPRRKEGEW